MHERNFENRNPFLFLSAILFVIMLISAVIFRGTDYRRNLFDQNAERKNAVTQMAENSNEVVIEIERYNDSVRLEMVYEKNSGNLFLRIPLGTGLSGSVLLDLMKRKVLDLTSEKRDIKLGDYIFKYSGGYPAWGPFGGYGHPGYQCLLFSKNASIKGNVIYAKGSASKEPWYGYDMWESSSF